MVNSGKILVVDDDPAICELLSLSLSRLGYEVATANDGLSALERIEAEQFNVAILDLMLPGPDGIEILKHIRERQTGPEVIMLTAHASLDTAVEALRLGAYDYITKPFQVNEVRSTVARALEKQRLEKRLVAIYDLSREMALSLNVEQAAEAVLDVVERVLEFKTCGLGLIDEQQNDIYCLAARGMERETVPRIRLNGEKGIVAAAVRSREPVYAPDTRDDPRYVEAETTTRSELAAPLKIRERVIGVLNVESAEVDGFSQSDIRLISTLTAQAAVAIENARLHEQARQEIAERKKAEAHALQLNRELTTLNQVFQTITFSLDLEETLTLIMEHVTRLLNTAAASVALYDEIKNNVWFAAASGESADFMQGMRMALGQGVVGWVIQQNEPVLAPDVTQDKRLFKGFDQKSGFTTRSLLCVPMQSKGKIIGAIEAVNKKSGSFDQQDLRLLTSIAVPAATAIENARLYKQAQHEIAERKRAEEEIKHQRNYYQSIIDNLHDQVIVIDHDYCISDANDVFLRQTGCAREEVIGQSCYEVIQQQDAPCQNVDFPCPLQQIWETGQPARFTQTRYDQEGNARWLDVTASPLRDAAGRVTHVIEAYRDATAERQLEERLSGVHALGRELILSRGKQQIAQIAVDAAIFLSRSQLCGLWLVDQPVDQKEQTLLPQAYAGRTESMSARALPLDDQDNVVAAAARSGKLIYLPDVRQEPRYTGMNANLETQSALYAPLEIGGELIGVLSAESDRLDGFNEITRRLFSTLADYSALALENAHLYEAEREQHQLVEQSQAQLVQSEKLAATGRLVASLAHEINNPLQAIRSNLQIVLDFPLEPAEQREYLHMADEEVERLAGIMTRMLDFARRPKREMRSTNVNDVIEKVLTLTNKHLQHRHIALRRDLSPAPPYVLAAPGELEQVFLNLVLNAVDSMPEGGNLRISSHTDGGGRLAVTFSDTGGGISPEHLDRIFEPFFSTKQQSTGLGLSVSHSIIERHRGRIVVQSADGEGATFTVWLPVIAE